MRWYEIVELVAVVFAALYPITVPVALGAAFVGYKIQSAWAVLYLGLLYGALMLGGGPAADLVKMIHHDDPSSLGYMMLGLSMFGPALVLTPWAMGLVYRLVTDRVPQKSGR